MVSVTAPVLVAAPAPAPVGPPVGPPLALLDTRVASCILSDTWEGHGRLEGSRNLTASDQFFI